jgi:hypothetical protein
MSQEQYQQILITFRLSRLHAQKITHNVAKHVRITILPEELTISGAIGIKNLVLRD